MSIHRESLWEIVGYTPSEAQSLIHEELDTGTDIVVAVFGRQAGKTYAATYDSLMMISGHPLYMLYQIHIPTQRKYITRY